MHDPAPQKDAVQSDAEHVLQVYEGRYASDKERYSLFAPGEHYMDVAFERDLIGTLKRVGFEGLGDIKMLEVGCGDGRRLRNFQRLGAVPANQYGVELIDFYVRDAACLSSNCTITQGNAAALEFEDASFDLVFQRTVFSSVLDPGVRQRIAREMVRVLKDDGLILWYDIRYNNPSNPDVRGIGREEIEQLFAGCACDTRAVSLAPPLARRLAPLSWILCMVAEKLKPLRTHYLATIRKNPGD